jgi:very-short-patch-repair endonuclease
MLNLNAGYSDLDIPNLVLDGGNFDFRGRRINIAPQYQLSGYLLDFAIVCLDFDSNLIRLNVEADGHDWHERTKEQASRDRLRDRDLLTRGWPTMRFTGSEIWKSPEDCVGQINQYLMTASEVPLMRSGELGGTGEYWKEYIRLAERGNMPVAGVL